jgi:hypothetical protein
MPGCARCGHKLEQIVAGSVGRRDVCPGCDSELHACIMCRHYDPAVAKGCKEPFAEVPRDREGANFCEFFQIGEGGNLGFDSKKELLSAAEALFKKK